MYQSCVRVRQWFTDNGLLGSARAGTIKWIFFELLTKRHNTIYYIHIGKMSHKYIIDESIILLNWEIEKATFPLFTGY